MRRTLIFLGIALWMLVIVGSVWIIFAGPRWGDIGRILNAPTGAHTLLQKGQIALGSVQNIVIDCSYHSVELRTTLGDTIKVRQYGDANTDENALFSISVTDERIRIYFDNRTQITTGFFRFGSGFSPRLIVEIPEAFSANLEISTSSGHIELEDDFSLANVDFRSSSGRVVIDGDLNVTGSINMSSTSGSIRIDDDMYSENDIRLNTASGSINIDGEVHARNLEANTASGSIRIERPVTATERLSLQSISGSIRVGASLKAETLSAQSTSGSVTLSGAYTESFNLRSTSGSLRTGSVSGSGSANTVSGSIRLTLGEARGEVSLRSVSGSVRLELHPSLQFNLVAETSSGSINTNFPTERNNRGNRATATFGSDPTVNINAQSTSGGIRVERIN